MKYKDAAKEAQRKADETGRDHGLSKDYFGDWNTFTLPARRFRSGHELRCEVRSCTSWDRMLAGHGSK